MSTRDVQNIQRTKRGVAGQPKPKTVHREGKTRTVFGSSQTHGSSITPIFRTFEEAQAYVTSGNIPKKFNKIAIQLKFAESAIPGKKYPARRKDGVVVSQENYATLTEFYTRDAAMHGPTKTQRQHGAESMWEKAYSKLNNFVLDKDSRFYIFARER